MVNWLKINSEGTTEHVDGSYLKSKNPERSLKFLAQVPKYCGLLRLRKPPETPGFGVGGRKNVGREE